jgi:hypothetical protein
MFSSNDLFHYAFAISAGISVANLAKELVVTAINQVAAALIMRKQVAQMKKMQASSGYAQLGD